MIHDHPSQRKGYAMKIRWNNEYFARIGLMLAYWLYNSTEFGYNIDYMNKNQKKKQASAIERAKEKGQEYYTPDRVCKMQCAWKLATK